MRVLLLLLCGLAGSAGAQEQAGPAPDAQGAEAQPRIVAIQFVGNEVTQPRVMLREITLVPGDPADPARIEASRQAILDLGLFRSVEASLTPTADGVILVFELREKLYFLPFPRFDAKDSGEYAYGAQLRWANVRGLNQNLRLSLEQRDRKEAGVGEEINASLAYSIPQFRESRNTLGFSLGYTTRPVDNDNGQDYQERFLSAQALVSRSLSQGSPNQGWTLGGGLLWQQQETSGAFAVPAYGMATAPVLTLGFRDLHFRRYSELGTRLSARLEIATPELVSDYDYVYYGLSAARFIPMGARAHQSLHLLGELGVQHGGGSPDNERFGLGGASALRGYDSDFVEGDAYYRLATEFLRPVGWDWLRAFVVLEVGNAYERPRDVDLWRMRSSIGVGLRARIDWFVDLELDLGYAVPLDDRREGGRIFAGRP